MKTTRRTTSILLATAAIAGAIALPTAAMVPPPEPDASQLADPAPSPAMSAGRTWCACNGIDYQPLWIQ